MDLDHGDADGVAAEVGGGGLLDAGGAQRNVGGGSAHVQGDDVGVAGLDAGVKRADDSAGGSAEDGANGLFSGEAGGDAAPGGLHDAEAATEDRFQLGEVAGHDGADVGVDDHGAGALVLAELGQDFRGDRDEWAVGQFSEALGQGLLVDGVEEGEEEGDGDAIDFGFLEERQQGVYGFGREVFEDCAGVVDALREAEAELPRGQGRGPFHGQVVEVGAVLASDFEHILEAESGDQGGASALALQEGVGGDGAAVDEVGGGDVDAGFADALCDAQ